ncbi:hypothetical protein B0J14DRAFT_646541 [Halenospora varia]|nr:hypothetical protein B0J14DRAFT_646541 [Halenospora varia]
MFDIPQAKRVRRNDLYTRSQSSSPAPSSPDPELERQFQARLASLYGPLTASNNATASNIDLRSFSGFENLDIEDAVEDDKDAPDNHEFEFRLFSTSATTLHKNPASQKIILEEEDSDLGEGGFIKPCREPTYYFASKAEGDEKWKFDNVALTGEQVKGLSKRRAWGLEVPWRVRVLKVVGAKLKLQADGAITGKVETIVEGEDEKRKRPGKKRRIILRERKKRRELLAEQKRKEQELKEETEKEKRTRRNREKKVKRKLKEKAKKEEGNSTTTTNTANIDQGDPVAEDAVGQGIESD